MLKQSHRSLAVCFGLIICSAISAYANLSGEGIWKEIDDTNLRSRPAERLVVPNRYRTFRLNKAELLTVLRGAPEESKDGFTRSEAILSLPMPDGTFERFRIEHSLIVEPGLRDKYPELGETFRGQGIDDPTATVRFDFLPSGFHSMILSAKGTVIVDPYAEGDSSNYVSYFKRDVSRQSDFLCGFEENTGIESLLSVTKTGSREFIPDSAGPSVSSGTQLRTYRLALAGNVEYTAAAGGGTVAGALAAQVLIMNRVNGVYERDLAIRMVLIANSNLIIFTAEPDNYTNGSGSTMLGQNQTQLDTIIGSANYDIGHVFSTGGGGVANLNGPCGGNKARGVTGLANPVGDPFAIDYVAHEMGHQWGANHTFNGGSGNCAGSNRSASNAYEPGSGVTIMAYAGICGAQDLEDHSIDTFHVRSLEAIVAFSQTGNGNSCAAATSTGNTPPTVSSVGGTSFNIPKQTPFTLTATSTDPNGDSVTYDWQEYDLGASTTAVPNTDSDGTARPIFRPYLPTSGGSRTFPSLQYVLNNGNLPPASFGGGLLTGELLPAITRTMTFQVVARDNRADGGGINTTTVTVGVTGTIGPFKVTSPDTSIVLNSGVPQNVTWDVAGSNGSPVNAANVRISLSTDGGLTFPTVLAASTANDGSESVTLPAIGTTQARIMIEGVGNIFFDIGDTNFTINAAAPTSGSVGGRIVDGSGR